MKTRFLVMAVILGLLAIINAVIGNLFLAGAVALCGISVLFVALPGRPKR